MMIPKPRTLQNADTLQAVEQRIVDALPEIIDALIGQAKAEDLKAAVYLAGWLLGRSAGAKIGHRFTATSRKGSVRRSAGRSFG